MNNIKRSEKLDELFTDYVHELQEKNVHHLINIDDLSPHVFYDLPSDGSDTIPNFEEGIELGIKAMKACQYIYHITNYKKAKYNRVDMYLVGNIESIGQKIIDHRNKTIKHLNAK